ncbi:MAG TPA: methyltransferase domain-containing protein [Afipia sp.]
MSRTPRRICPLDISVKIAAGRGSAAHDAVRDALAFFRGRIELAASRGISVRLVFVRPLNLEFAVVLQPVKRGDVMHSAFKEFEHGAWQNVVDQYDASFSRLTQQVVPAMLDVLGVKPGTFILDVACGPGYLAAAAQQMGAKARGVDFSAMMVTRALALHPAIPFDEGDAESLENYADNSFDAVAMNFGILHLDRPENALKAMHRLLKPGGKLAFTAWGMQNTVAGFAIPLKAIQMFGDPGVQLPPGPPFFLYSDPGHCREALARCGYAAIDTKIVDQTWIFGSPDEFFEALLHGTARTGGMLKRQPPERLQTIKANICSAANANLENGKIVLPMPAHLVWATKP